MPVMNNKRLINLFPPDDRIASYPPKRALKTIFDNSEYLFLPLISTKYNSSIKSVKSFIDLVLFSIQRVILQSG